MPSPVLWESTTFTVAGSIRPSTIATVPLNVTGIEAAAEADSRKNSNAHELRTQREEEADQVLLKCSIVPEKKGEEVEREGTNDLNRD